MQYFDLLAQNCATADVICLSFGLRKNDRPAVLPTIKLNDVTNSIFPMPWPALDTEMLYGFWCFVVTVFNQVDELFLRVEILFREVNNPLRYRGRK